MAESGTGGVVRRGSGRGPQEQGKSKRTGPIRCRVCGKALIEPVDRKLGRCTDCPSDLDQALYQQLRDWRLTQAQTQSVPTYVIFTDATLTAIAEIKPTTRAALAKIPGVVAAKVDRYADEVLTILNGDPAPAPEDESQDVGESA
jgi:DNA helicase-2/ATP-dependent DNA helicase PcrA